MTKAISSSVNIASYGRLHMGFFDLHGGLGRKFGSIGLSLSAPQQLVTAGMAEQLQVSGDSQVRATHIAANLLQKLNIKTALSLNIEQHIPEHAGLGSGTQLALAIGYAVNHLYQLNLSTSKIAELTGRGARSGIGIAAFDHGGLLIDGGRISNPASLIAKTPPLLARYDFPEQWRILLIFDSEQQGVHGVAEQQAFSQLPEFSENLAAHLCRHVLMQAMPALLEHDLTGFGHAIQTLQSHVGDYFSPAQGGRYASSKVAAVLDYLAHQGVSCFGQSSWGPTGFAVFENALEADKQLQQLTTNFTDSALSWLICSGRNQGAEVTATTD